MEESQTGFGFHKTLCQNLTTTPKKSSTRHETVNGQFKIVNVFQWVAAIKLKNILSFSRHRIYCSDFF